MRWITSCQQFNSKLRRLQHVNLIALHHNDRCCADQWPIPRPGSSLFLVWRRRLKKQRSLVAAWRHQRPIVSRVFRQNRGLAKTKFCIFTSASFIHDRLFEFVSGFSKHNKQYSAFSGWQWPSLCWEIATPCVGTRAPVVCGPSAGSRAWSRPPVLSGQQWAPVVINRPAAGRESVNIVRASQPSASRHPPRSVTPWSW